MKKINRILLPILGVFTLLTLTACVEKEDFVETELSFIKLDRDGSSAYAFYESHTDKTYYELEITSYQYNNWDTAGYPNEVKVIRTAEKFYENQLFSQPYYKAIILSDLDEKKDKELSSIERDKVKLTDLDQKLITTNYWGEKEKDSEDTENK